ncbi:MAG: IS256 family transposase [Candidatus Eisenbacteria bacterium]|nr:IS256 family transposase [Candidatus Eisenbacteria bacterium]
MGNGSRKPGHESRVSYENLEGWAREKVQGFIQDILEEEVTEFLGRGKSERVGKAVDGPVGYRNGHGKTRKFAMMNGTVIVRRPRVRGTDEAFESRVLPIFKRRSKELGDVLPDLYLHGLASGDFELALRGLLGDGAPLSRSSIVRLKAKWQVEYEEWKDADLSGLEVVYQWADGLYVKAGLEKDRAALLVIVVGLSDGRKAVVACESGYRESKESWAGVLRDLRARGLKLGRLTIADGNLGIWAALGELHPEGTEQRCWNHKIVNVLNAFSKKEQPKAREFLRQMAYAGTRRQCEKYRDNFIARYKRSYPKATETLLRDWSRMVTFYSFPKEHWPHLRSTNVVESPFAPVRLRTNAARRFKRVDNAVAMIWKLLMVAEKSWRRLKGTEFLSDVYEGKKYVDGLPEKETNAGLKEAA